MSIKFFPIYFVLAQLFTYNLFAEGVHWTQFKYRSSQGRAIRLGIIPHKKPIPPFKLTVKCFGKHHVCYPISVSEYEAWIAVPADISKGKHFVQVWKGRKILEIREIEIDATDFPTENLPLTDDKKQLLKTSQKRTREVKKIRQALEIESPYAIGWKPFIKPVEGRLVGVYGERRLVDGKMKNGYHRGIDLAAPEGTEIIAPQNADVVLSGAFIEEGNMVILDHGRGLTTAYLHLSKIRAKKGQKVKQGDVIGWVGSTGVSTSPHLHWGVYLHGVPFDPQFWLNRL